MVLILKNCRYIVTQNKKRDILEHTDIRVNGNLIVAINQQKITKDDLVIDCSRHIVLPGLVNMQTHLSRTFLRGKEDKIAEHKLKDHDAYKWSYVGAIESIKFGTTTVCDTSHFSFSTAKALEDVGMRAFIRGIPRNKSEEALVEDFIDAYKEHPLLIPVREYAYKIYTPSFNMKSGKKKFIGKETVLGTEGADMFEEMRIAALLQNLKGTKSPARKILDMATLNAGNALKKKIGVLAENHLADIIVLEMSEHIFPVSKNNVVERIVYNAKGSDVCTVIVDGSIRYFNRKLMPVLAGTEAILRF